MKSSMNRRQFFLRVVQGVGVIAAAPLVMKVLSSEAMAEQRRAPRPAEGGAAAGGMPLVDPKDSVAKAVKYVEDHKKVPEAKGNHCGNCGFYAKKENRNGKEVGTCTIFAGKLVYADAYCASWNKKA